MTAFFCFFAGAVKAINACNGSVFQYILLGRVEAVIDPLTHKGSFMETTENKFELAWVGIHIAYGIDAFYIGLIIKSVLTLIALRSISIPNRQLARA